MELDIMLADLANRFDTEKRRADLDAIAEMAEAERSTVTLAARVAAAVGRRITVILRGGERMEGTIGDAADGWMLLSDGEATSVVVMGAITAIWPLGHAAARADRVSAGLGVSHILREIAAQGVPVVIGHDGGVHRGYLTAVMADHLELRPDGGSAVCLSFAGLRTLRLAAR